jgi:SpoVK/Ycf46/Vps4 family AAA+-type ATPase
LFFDEIDAIACNRSQDDTVDVMSRLLSTLLNEMDGVSSGNGRVLVVACTNRLETLDAALLRPGRLEEHILVPRPSFDDVEEIVGHYLARVPLQEDVIFEHVARDLANKETSAADIEGVCREAVYQALRRHAGRNPSEVFISIADIDSAMGALKL